MLGALVSSFATQLALKIEAAESVLGPYSCIGKNLGLMEIRTAIVLLLDKFDIKFADGEDGTKLFKESKDCFSWVPGPLNLVFNKRNSEAKIDVNAERTT